MVHTGYPMLAIFFVQTKWHTIHMKRKRTYADRRGYLINAVKKRRKKIRKMAIEILGGKCVNCGYDRCSDALDIHHRNSSEKDFGISARGYTRSWEKIKDELNKCDLLCANCHRELHAQLSLSLAS